MDRRKSAGGSSGGAGNSGGASSSSRINYANKNAKELIQMASAAAQIQTMVDKMKADDKRKEDLNKLSEKYHGKK